MNKRRILSFATMTLILAVLLLGCSKKEPGSTSGARTDITTSYKSAEEIVAEMNAAQGDGTINISLTVSNPDQKREKYNLILAAPGSFKAGEPLRFFKSIEIEPGEAVTVNIMDLYSYCEMDDKGTFKIGLTAAQLEDVNVRNPLSEIMVLTFPNLQTCSQGENITLNITDKPLTSIYPEGTFLVRIVDPANEGGYVDFMYKGQNNATLKYGRGSSGPDFLVTFEASEFKKKGIRDAVLVISNASNQHISDQVSLQFDENGYCKQGQYIEMAVKR